MYKPISRVTTCATLSFFLRNVVQHVIVNVFPQMGQFYYAAKAFDVLERLDPNPEYWEGKRGACVGIFQQIIAGHEPRLDINCLFVL